MIMRRKKMSEQKVQKTFASQKWHDEYDSYKKCQFAKLNHKRHYFLDGILSVPFGHSYLSGIC